MLRGREEEEESQLKGVVLAADVKDLPLGSFEGLANFVPGKLYSLKRKRGVAAFTSAALTPTAPSAC